MKKFYYVVLFCIFVLLNSASSCFADYNNMNIYFNGEKIDLTVAPIIDEEEILVPMNDIFEVLDINSVLKEDERTIETDWGITLNVGSGNLNVMGIESQLSNKVQLINDNIMIPIEFISDILLYDVILNSKDMEIYITVTGYDGALKKEVTTESELFVVDGIGAYEGYKILKGYPEEKKFLVYYKGKPGSYIVHCQDLRAIDLDEVISWNYNGSEIKSQLKDLYDFFSDGLYYNSNLEIDDESELSQKWFIETFGQTYLDWVDGEGFAYGAERLVKRYFEESGQIKVKNRFDSINSAFDEMVWIGVDELEKLGITFYNINNIYNMCEEYSDGDVIFSGMRMRKTNGSIEFNKADLRAKNIIE